jgi:hypothetical protein
VLIEFHLWDAADDIPVVLGYASANQISMEATSRKTTYTFHRPQHKELEINAIVVKKYSKGRFKRTGTRWFADAVGQLPHSIAPHQVFEMYRQRFGIETSYRQSNLQRARKLNQKCTWALLGFVPTYSPLLVRGESGL